MRITNYCDECMRKSACKLNLNGITPTPKYENIVIFCRCELFKIPRGVSCGCKVIDNLRSEFNHCDNCNFASQCKYYKNEEMIEKIKSITNALTKHGNIEVKIVCTMYDPNEDAAYGGNRVSSIDDELNKKGFLHILTMFFKKRK